jgi:predicted RecA/RadA family phage recombinase
VNGTATVVINEVAWMGTECSAYDEWVELYNMTESPVDIADWSFYGIHSGECLNVSEFAVATGESTVIAAGDYLILGNSFDIFNSGATVHLATTAVQLTNTGGQIILYDAADCAGDIVDIAGTGGEWPAGRVDPYITMERIWASLCGNNAYNWADFEGTPIASDACDLDVNGSPEVKNSVTP